MCTLDRAAEADAAFVLSLDRHVAPDELRNVMRLGRAFVIREDGADMGTLRYALFWDSIPFMNMLYLREEARGRGLGRQAVALWERAMTELGHTAVMTSTQADESAQHFYRKLGYKDAGCLILPAQPLEIILFKPLAAEAEAT